MSSTSTSTSMSSATTTHRAAAPHRARRRHRHPRVRRPASSSSSANDDKDKDEDWMTLERVFILVFDMDTEREAIYTTSSRTPTRATNAFVVFETLLDAVRAAMALSEVTREMPVVDEVPPAVVSLLRESAAYDVEFVRENGEFRVPEVIIDEGATVVRDADGERAVEARALAMSAEDLAAYVSTSKARVVVEDEDEDEDEARIEAARTNAARVMRDALRAPVIAVRDAAKSASDAPVRGAKIYVSAAKSAMRAMVDVARRRARDGE